MKLNRKTLLLLALAVVAGLAVFAPPPPEPVAPVARSGSLGAGKGTRDGKDSDSALPARATANKQKAGDTAGSGVPTLSEYPERGILGKPNADLFGTQSWLPPPPKVVVEPPPPPPPPQPPALTFRFAGRFLQDGKSQVYVSNGDTPLAVKVGDTLDGYVVESISAGSIALVYPPLAHRQSIAIPPDVSQGSSGPAAAFGPVLGNSAAVQQPQPQPGNAAAAVPPKPAATTARVKWDGPAQIKMGANFSVVLRAEADQPISGSAIQVRFDPTVLESVSVQPGKLYAAEVGRGFSHRVNPDGSIFVGANRQSAAPLAPLSPSAPSASSGDAELLILTFKPLKSGSQAEVSLASLNILGTGGRTVLHDTLASYRATVIR
jgi:hypothetical protein